MKCQDFLDRWLEGKGFARMRPSLLLHRLGCRRCREELDFLKGLSDAMKSGEGEEDEAFFEKLSEGVLEVAKKEGFVSRESLPSGRFRLVPRLFLPAAGALVVLMIGALLFVGKNPPNKSVALPYTLSWDLPERETFISQLDDRALAGLDSALEGSFGGDSSFVFDLTTAPWAEVVDQVSAHPYLLDSLFPGDRGKADPYKKRGGVA